MSLPLQILSAIGVFFLLFFIASFIAAKQNPIISLKNLFEFRVKIFKGEFGKKE